jgi:hypothetical protein
LEGSIGFFQIGNFFRLGDDVIFQGRKVQGVIALHAFDTGGMALNFGLGGFARLCQILTVRLGFDQFMLGRANL